MQLSSQHNHYIYVFHISFPFKDVYRRVVRQECRRCYSSWLTETPLQTHKRLDDDDQDSVARIPVQQHQLGCYWYLGLRASLSICCILSRVG
jgi:hypothetical protein